MSFASESDYAEAFINIFPKYMALDASAYVGGSTKRPEASNTSQEDFVPTKIKQAMGNIDQLTRLFDQMAIADEIMSREYELVQKAKKENRLENHLAEVVHKIAAHFLNPSTKELNDTAIKAIGEENYKKIIANLTSPDHDEIRAKTMIANEWVKGIAVSYPQRLLDYCKNKKIVQDRTLMETLSLLGSLALNITKTNQSEKKLISSLDDMKQQIFSLQTKNQNQLAKFNAYKNTNPHLVGDALERLNLSIKYSEFKRDELETILNKAEALNTSPEVLQKNLELLKISTNRDQIIQQQWSLIQAKENIFDAIETLEQFERTIKYYPLKEFSTLNQLTQTSLRELRVLNISDEINPLQVNDLLRQPIIELAQYVKTMKQIEEENPNDEETIAIYEKLIADKKEAILTINKSDFKERYQDIVGKPKTQENQPSEPPKGPSQ